MKTIISFNINGSKNEVCKAFGNLMVPHIKACEVICKNFAPQVDELERTAKVFSDCLMNHRFSELTEDVLTLDTRRDRKWSAARMVIVSELESLDPTHKRAAETINRLFDSFGKIRTMGYAEQSGAMGSLCSDLLLNHRAELELLGLVPLIEDLQEANNDFCKAYEERTELMSGHQKDETRQAKQAFCMAYRTLIFLVNAYIVQHGLDGLEEFVAYANKLIEQYRAIIGQRPTQGGDVDLDFDDSLEDEDNEGEDEGTPNPPAGGGTGSTTPTLYTIRFTHNGQVVGTQQLAEGATITAPAAPAGYQWDNCPATMPARDVTVTTKAVSGGGTTPGEDQPF